MAGHNFSRYLTSFWSAAFAPFYFLFPRLWRFFANQTTRPNIASPPPPSLSPQHSPRSPSRSCSTSTSLTQEPPLINIPAEITNAAASPSLSVPSPVPSSPSSPPPRPHDQAPSYSTAGEELPNCDIIDISSSSSSDSHNSNTSPDHAIDPFPPVSPWRPSVDMTKRRAGRGRGGARSSSFASPTLNHQSTAAMPGTPVAAAANTIKDWPASPSQSDTNPSGDTGFTLSRSTGPKFTSSKGGGNQAPDRSFPTPQRQPLETKKENVALLRDNDTTSYAVPMDSPVPTPLTTKHNTGENQQSGTRSRSAIDPDNTSSVIKSLSDVDSSSRGSVSQLHVIADRLTLEDTTPSQKTDQSNLNEATAAAEASALPVPLVVAVPMLSDPQAVQCESQGSSTPILPGLIEPTTDEERAEREYHLGFMRKALDMGGLALKTNETPVGCVLVYHGRVIARGMNATNVTRNGTRHAEFMALSALLSRRQPGDISMTKMSPDFDDASWGDVDPTDGHIYPYGQKLHPAPIVDRAIISECVLYVTVEPCVMCASLLRQLGIKKVYFGAVNDKFGGTGGVFRVHLNSKPVIVPKDRPYQQGYGPQDIALISKGRAVVIPRDNDEGDGGNVESGYPVEGGYLRDDAVSLLRRFYVQENGRAPQPRKKEGRAARLYAALETQNKSVNTSDLSDNAPETPVESETPMLLSEKPDSAVSIVCV